MTDIPPLEQLRKDIGAPLVNWRPTRDGSETIELHKKLKDGMIITSPSDIAVGPIGLLTHYGEQIIIYIKDTQDLKSTLENKPEESRRIHVAECETIEEMRKIGRFARYVMSNRKDGKVPADWYDPDTDQKGTVDAALKICKNCLTLLNYRCYQTQPDGTHTSVEIKFNIWREFSLEEFFLDHTTLIYQWPLQRDVFTPLNLRPDDWGRISERHRLQGGRKCEKCGVCIKGISGALHVHHINGMVNNNSPKNLMVLCALCHAEQRFHKNRVKISQKLRRAIEAERKLQNITFSA